MESRKEKRRSRGPRTPALLTCDLCEEGGGCLAAGTNVCTVLGVRATQVPGDTPRLESAGPGAAREWKFPVKQGA